MIYSIEELLIKVIITQIISTETFKLENIERNVKSSLEC